MPIERIQTVASILASVSDEHVLDALDRLYHEDQRENYQEILTTLRALEPKPSTMNCELAVVTYVGSDAPRVDVRGREVGGETVWGIEFAPWPEWLGMGMTFGPGTPEMTDAEIMAHVLNEITWGGWSQEDMEYRRDEIKTMAAEVADAIERGDTSDLIKIDLPKAN